MYTESTMGLHKHELVQKSYYPDLLSVLDLSRRYVVEFGTGAGFLTRLILQNNPMGIIGYEIEKGLCKVEHCSLNLKEMDFTKDNFSYLNKDHCIISNPPSDTLDFILELLDEHKISDAIILVDDEDVQRMEEIGFKIQLTFDGEAFKPKTTGFFHVMKRGFRKR